MRGIYWLRSDLRLLDNPALSQFCLECSEGLIVWAPTQSYLRAEVFRQKFIRESLSDFQMQIQGQGQKAVEVDDMFSKVLPEILKDFSPEKIYFNSEISAEETQEEELIESICQSRGITVAKFPVSTLLEEDDLPFTLAEMPFIFTDFRKKIEANLIVKPALPAPRIWPSAIQIQDSENLMKEISFVQDIKKLEDLLFGGELAGLARVKSYFWETEAVLTYKQTRNGMLNTNDSSKFSPWINSGCLSARYIYGELKKFESQRSANDSTYWIFFGATILNSSRKNMDHEFFKVQELQARALKLKIRIR